MFDIVIRGGRVYTGAGNPWFKSDIGIKEGKICKIDKIIENTKELIDASDLAVSPGFIDMHDHSDLTILVNREAESKIHTGVTTITFPSCGSGPSPLNQDMKEKLLKNTPYLREAGVDVDWTTVDGYLSKLESEGLSVNVAPLIGFGTIRRYVMGMEMRAPTDEELEAMKQEITEAMKAGCRGITTGLRYDPQSYADTEEVIELSKIVAKYGGSYHSHIRDEGDRGDPKSAIKEIIRIGEEAGIPVNISHFKILSKSFWHIVPEVLEMIEEARKSGVQITADQYPYIASGTSPGAWIPKWANEGGIEALARRLKDPKTSEKIKEGLIESMEERGGPRAALISTYPLNPNLIGMTIEDVAKEMDISPEDAIFLLFKKHTLNSAEGRIEGGFSFVNFNQTQENVDHIIRQRWVAIGTDGRVHAPYGILSKHIPAPHPRFYGTFPRVLGRYVRERGILELPDTVRKMTSLPAQIHGLNNRGLIQPSYWADITIFDPETIIDKAVFTPPEESMRYPEGVHYVIVNGKTTLREGKHTGERAGSVLRA